MSRSKFQDGDYILSTSGLVFSVHSNSHGEDMVFASPKYVPYQLRPTEFWGHRWTILENSYSRIGWRMFSNEQIEATYDWLEATFPDHILHTPKLGRLCVVPMQTVVHHFRPTEALQKLIRSCARDELQDAAVKLALQLSDNAKIPRDEIGVTGSIMLNSHTVGFSDIDLVIYGYNNWLCYQEWASESEKPNSIVFPDEAFWTSNYVRAGVQDMPLTPESYARHKARKHDQGLVDGHKFSVFAIRGHADPLSIVDMEPIEPVGIRAMITDCQESAYTPSIYEVVVDEVLHGDPGVGKRLQWIFVDNRREYVYQSFRGEAILAFGMACRCRDRYVLWLGSPDLRRRDYLVTERWDCTSTLLAKEFRVYGSQR